MVSPRVTAAVAAALHLHYPSARNARLPGCVSRKAMNLKNSFVQGVLLVLIAAVLALLSNAVAGRERKLVLPGFYPNAMAVPARTPEPPTTATAPVVAVTTDTASTAAAPTASLPPDPIAATATTATSEAATKPVPAPAKPAPAAVVPGKSGPAIVANPEVVEADPMKRFPPHPDKPYVEISGDDAAWLRSKGALVIDARRSSIYEQGHIAGARSMPVWESDVDDRVNKLFNERSDPREQLQPIVIYCSGGDCEDSHMLAQKLWGVQFNNIYVYKDGFPDWQKRGGPIDAGSKP